MRRSGHVIPDLLHVPRLVILEYFRYFIYSCGRPVVPAVHFVAAARARGHGVSLPDLHVPVDQVQRVDFFIHINKIKLIIIFQAASYF